MGDIVKTSYASTDMEYLFEGVGSDCNTLNFRILWQDTFVSRDHHVMQHVLATGFNDFEKGVTVKLRCAT